VNQAGTPATRVALAASNEVAASAGRVLAEAGGNAVDAAVAATVASCCTEPGVCSLGGGTLITVAEPGRTAVGIDAGVEMPGRGLPPHAFGRGMWEYRTDYAGGTRMLIGHGTVATPGTLAGLAHLHQHWGRAPWADVLAPTVAAVRDGFPMGASNHHYLEFVHDELFGWHAPSRAAIHDADGALIGRGAAVRIPALADTLGALSDDGVDVFYRGELGAAICDEVTRNDGILTREDLAAYAPSVQPARTVTIGGWEVDVPAAPSIGGAALAAMLVLLDGAPRGAWTPDATRRVVQVQHAVMAARTRELDVAEDLTAAADRFVARALADGLDGFARSPSTVHISAVDDHGLAVAVTASSGYGSGVMPDGTGIWLNNSLGELELNRRGVHQLEPGTRLPSNMAPSLARHHDRVLSVGSPGADRITTALQQVLAGVVNGGLSLRDAIRHPRVHVVLDGDDAEVRYEDDVDLPALALPTRAFPPLSMAFGGVGAVMASPDGLEAHSDPRRDGVAVVT
jgi:gamma-glutamyltranspeptidase/glutathione hydrolase